MTVNTRLQENPILQSKPKTDLEWVYFMNELAQWVRYIVKLGDGSLTTSSGTTISGLTQMPGILVGGESLPTVNNFNKSSVQNITTLTSADVGSDTTTTIAAHNIVYDNGTVAYNSGTITGLPFNTLTYVYAEDASKAGGAVTYISTTTATDIVATTGRYFVGQITTDTDGGGGTSGGGGGGGGRGVETL